MALREYFSIWLWWTIFGLAIAPHANEKIAVLFKKLVGVEFKVSYWWVLWILIGILLAFTR